MYVMAPITKKAIEHLANLSRLEFSNAEKDKFVADLGNILNYFQELEAVNTDNVLPMTGGTSSRNIFREDEFLGDSFKNKKNIIESFPEEDRGYNKVPPIF